MAKKHLNFDQFGTFLGSKKARKYDPQRSWFTHLKFKFWHMSGILRVQKGPKL